MDVTSLPDHVLGSVFSKLTSPADRMSVLLACKRFLSAAVAHSTAWWESLRVANNKGDRQDSFWTAHQQQVRSLDVANNAMGGRPGLFLQQVLGLVGLPALETLKVEAPDSDGQRVWMEQAFQVINTLSTLRHLHLNLDDTRTNTGRVNLGILKRVRMVPLLLAPGVLSSLQSLDLNVTCKLVVPPGALRALGSLTRLHICADLGRPRSSRGSGATLPFGLGWADLEGTTALRQLNWEVKRSSQMSLTESEALSLLGRLEQLSLSPAECCSTGFLAALPRLAALTRVDLAFQRTQGMPSPAPMQAATACPNLKALTTNWLPPIQLAPGQLSRLTRLRLNFGAYGDYSDLDLSWFHAMPALETLEVSGMRLPAGMEALPSLKSLHFHHPLWTPGNALDRVSLLLHLTSLELEGFHTWPLPPGPYLSNLRSLALKWADAAAPILPALADALCLTSLKLFTSGASPPPSLALMQQPLALMHQPLAPAHWEADDVALLRALPSLAEVELVAFIERKVMDSKVGPVAPEWQQSAEALAAQLPGVAVTARKCTSEEAQSRFAWPASQSIRMWG